jgi:transcriptional regulator of heat shock response
MQTMHSLYVLRIFGTIKKEELLMSTVQENRFVNQVDMFWDGWLNNLKAVQSFQENLQQKALQAFSYQKELLDFSVKALNTMEEESKNFSKDWNEKVQNSVKQISNTEDEQVSKWLTNFQDVTESVQLFSWKPSHTVLDLLIDSQNQLEANMKKTLVSQKKENTENFKRIEGLIEQVKETQKEILSPIKA